MNSDTDIVDKLMWCQRSMIGFGTGSPTVYEEAIHHILALREKVLELQQEIIGLTGIQPTDSVEEESVETTSTIGG
jgi:hypothetical protein